MNKVDKKRRLNKPVFFFATGGCTTTCMVIAPVGLSPKVILESARVLLLSAKTLPACISFRSFTEFGVTVLSVKGKIPLKGKTIVLQKKIKKNIILTCLGHDMRKENESFISKNDHAGFIYFLLEQVPSREVLEKCREI